MLVDERGQPLSILETAPLGPFRYVPEEHRGPIVEVKLTKPWLDFDASAVVQVAPNQAAWLVRTERGVLTGHQEVISHVENQEEAEDT